MNESTQPAPPEEVAEASRPAGPPGPEVPSGGAPLKQRAIKGSVLTVLSQGVSQGLRVGGNLVLTRLLFPEAFGIMALVQVVIRGVEMFSDVGVRGSIIYNKRGKDPAFLNTAWTLQIIRGGVLWGVIALLALPAAYFYDVPQLRWLLPVVGFTSLVKGCASTARHSLTREVTLGRLIALDLGTQVIGLVTMMVLALFWKSVWALALGGIVATLAATVWSHRLIPGYSNKLQFDRTAATSLFRFGRWILISVSFAFLIDQGDKLVLGKLVTATELGVYTVAVVFSRMVTRIIQKLSFSVLQPVFSKLSEQEPAVMRRKVLKMRAVMIGASLPVLWCFAVFGEYLVDFLYDERYVDAGWMVRIIAVGAIGSVVAGTTERVILARGDSFRWMLLQVTRGVIFFLSMWAGLTFGDGIQGLLIGVAASRFISYIPLAYFLRRYGVWLPALDLGAFGLSAGVIGLGLVFF